MKFIIENYSIFIGRFIIKVITDEKIKKYIKKKKKKKKKETKLINIYFDFFF